MDFDEAIKSHAEWKTRLADYLAHPDKSLQPATVGDDGLCALGQWIRDQGARYERVYEFAALADCHAKFHHAAATIVARADADEDVTADIALGADSDYTHISAQITQILLALKRKLAAGGAG